MSSVPNELNQSSGLFIQCEELPYFLEAEARQIIASALADSQPQPQPRFVHLAGIPASGKSTYALSFLQRHQDFALVQFDGIMTSLDGYKVESAKAGLAEAFRRWELHARAIGYRLLQALVEQKRNVIFDHSASFANHLDLLQAVKERGYFVEMHHMDCPPVVAMKRACSREARLDRYTPVEYIVQRFIMLNRLLPLYQQQVDSFFTVSTDETVATSELFAATASVSSIEPVSQRGAVSPGESCPVMEPFSNLNGNSPIAPHYQSR